MAVVSPASAAGPQQRCECEVRLVGDGLGSGIRVRRQRTLDDDALRGRDVVLHRPGV